MYPYATNVAAGARRVTGRARVIAIGAAAAIAGAMVAAALVLRDAPTGHLTRPCGRVVTSPRRWRHVLWIVLENKSYASVIGAREAPFTNGIARACGLATNYHSVTHHSLANYVAATSGLDLAALQPFRSDCAPSASCTTAAPSIFRAVGDWKSYLESMPGGCVRHNAGAYATRHNPAIYYRGLGDCRQRDVWLGQLWRDLAADRLPAFGFVAPNLCHDTHDCSIATGDRWLRSALTTILASRAYRSGATAIFVTWDEGEPERAADCRAAPRDPGCHVPLLVLSPSTPTATRAGGRYDHYSLLRTSEELLGVSPLLGLARSAPSMRLAFHL